MVLVNMREALSGARENRVGVACINTPSLEYVRAAIAAAETANVPVVLAHAEAHDPYVPLEVLAPSMLAQAKEASVPVAVHLDHGVSREFIFRGLRTGFTSLMYDCSTLPVAENIRRVKELVEIVHPLGVSVEAELGEMPSMLHDPHEHVDEPSLTDPASAAEFVQQTGVDALAVSFGTAHGVYTGPPNLDFALLQELDEATGDTPLVMHGSSGVPLDDIRKAVEHGVTKINYYSHLASDSSRAISDWMESRWQQGATVFHHEVAQSTYEYAKSELTSLLTAFRG